MSETTFVLGPVLSFRGVEKDKKWKVTALIGVKEEEIPDV